MKSIFHHHPWTTTAAALISALLVTGLLQAQKPADKAPAPKPPVTPEKKKAIEKKKETVNRNKPIPSKPRATPPVSKADPRPAPVRPHPPQPSRPTLVPRGAGETVTFLGLAVADVSPEVRSQLDIPDGTGVSVGQAMPGSPAAKAGLKTHDVLSRLDDQILVNPEQFQALVRMKKPGEKVDLTYYRGGKKRTAVVTLATHRFPIAGREPQAHDPRFLPREPQALRRAPGQPHELDDHFRQLERQWTERMNRWMEEHGEEIGEQLQKSFEEAFKGASEMAPRFEKWLDDMQREQGHRSHRVETFDHRVSIKDDDGTITVINKDGKKFVTALDKNGKELFEGFCDTKEERARVPKEILEKIDRIQVDTRFHGTRPHPGADRDHHRDRKNESRGRDDRESRRDRERDERSRADKDPV